ncbi:MAG: protease pro-enzyme activation domain-containing protein, partial [Acidimicrobiales bacterium]
MAVGSAAFVPRGARRTGTLPGSELIEAEVLLPVRNPGVLARVVTAVSSPRSPLRGRFLSPAELTAEFSPTPGAVLSLADRLRSFGLKVDSFTPDRLAIHVTGSALALGRIFHTSFATYALADGRAAYANLSVPRVTSSLSREVEAVLGLDTLARYNPLDIGHRAAPTGAVAEPAMRREVTRATAPSPCQSASNVVSRDSAWSANRLATAYGMDRMYRTGDLGSGVTIALYELEPNQKTDVAAYDKCYG